MPGGILPVEGIADQLGYLLSSPIPGLLPWRLLLWSNDLVPTGATVLADLVESTWAGYTRATLTRSLWTVPTTTGDCAVSTWGTLPIQWVIGGPTTEKVYGYAMADYMVNKLRFVQRFEPADVFTPYPGATLQLLPRYTLTTGQC